MQHSNLYALDGLLILGVALVCVTILSGLHSLYCRTAAAVTEVERVRARPNPIRLRAIRLPVRPPVAGPPRHSSAAMRAS